MGTLDRFRVVKMVKANAKRFEKKHYWCSHQGKHGDWVEAAQAADIYTYLEGTRMVRQFSSTGGAGHITLEPVDQ